MKYSACKLIEKGDLCSKKSKLVANEIKVQESINSVNIVALKKVVKSEEQIFMFLDYCNGGDLKNFMELRRFNVHPDVI